MTTAKIHTTRLRLSRGPATTTLVASVRDRLREQQRRRIIDIGRSVSGGAFQVTAPIASPMRPPADWPTPDEIDAIIGTACYGYA